MNFGVNRDEGLTVISATLPDLSPGCVHALDELTNSVRTEELVIDLTSVTRISEDAAADVTAVVVRQNAERDVIVVADDTHVRTELDVSGMDTVVPIVHRLDQALAMLGRTTSDVAARSQHERHQFGT